MNSNTKYWKNRITFNVFQSSQTGKFLQDQGSGISSSMVKRIVLKCKEFEQKGLFQPTPKFWMQNKYVRSYQVLKYLKREFFFMHLTPNKHVNLKDVDPNDPTRFCDFLVSNYVASDGQTAITQKQILEQILTISSSTSME